jgi:hypothetical protein
LVLGKLKNWPGIKSYTLSITIFLSRQFLSSDCFWCAPFGYLYFHLLKKNLITSIHLAVWGLQPKAFWSWNFYLYH